MEGLTMVDRQPHHAHAVYHGPRHVDVRPAQLPLPTPYGSYKRPSPGPPASMYHSETQSETNHSSYSTLKRASVSRGVSTIQTPSFQRGDQPRPSLPSLRTVLGDTARSPPVTPRHHELALQPLPREPTYDQSTYKPPSLYPNKKTRTDSGWDGQGTDHAQSNNTCTLPYMASRPDESVRLQRQYSMSTPSSTESRSALEPLSNHASPRATTNSVRSPQFTAPPSFELPTRSGFHPQGMPHADPLRLGRVGTSLSGPYEASGRSRSPSASVTADGLRRASAYVGHGTAYPVDSRRHSFLPSVNNAGYRDDISPMSRLEGPPHGYSSPSYTYGQPFFVPSHYDYQNGKSRKRSNLPKQSTEIMKRWFEDNLHNPYPSEEQKRHFAAVAGINLTQVSNWFINHRRRCPELREKRDKGRATSLDESG